MSMSCRRHLSGTNRNKYPVYQYSAEGKFIKKHNSLSDACRFIGKTPQLGNGVKKNIDGESLIAYDFIWFTEKVKSSEAKKLNEDRYINHYKKKE